jgi:hypothetical protein
MTTATAQALSSIVFIQYWEKVAENIAIVTNFSHNF